MKLRDYQQNGFEKTLRMHDHGKRSVVLVLPPGGGKTFLGSHAAIEIGRRRNGCVLWVAHRKELIKQAAGTLKKIGFDSGIIAPWAKPDPSKPIQVASIQTLRSVGELPPFEVMVWDEVHHAVSDDWVHIAKECRRRKAFLIGLTATPERKDGRGLYPLFSNMIVVATPRTLISKGHLVPTEVLVPSRLIEDGVADMPVILWERHARGTKTIVFCESVEHSRAIRDEFDEHGWKAGHVDGDMTSRERDRVIKKFISGRLDILCNCQILTEGFDLPPIQTVMLARRVGSHSLYLQMTGRGSRPYGNKKTNLVLDLTGTARLFGLPDEDRVFSLKGRPISLKDASSLSKMRKCKVCGMLFARRLTTCTHCGMPIEKDGKSRRVYKDRLHKMTSSEAEAYKRAQLDRWTDYARIHNKPAEWAEQQFFKKFGRMP